MSLLALQDKTVLFAEDDTITRTKMAEIFEMLFKRVYVASDGEDALRLYEEVSPDILISDIKMPRRDGLSLSRRIRKDNYTLPIILMTSFAEQDLLIDAANLSIDGYLVKPVDLDKLTSTIMRAFQRLPKRSEIITLLDDLYYNSATKMLYRNGEAISLGLKEQELLNLLLDQRHRTVSKEEIAQTLWPLDPICESAIKNIILRLRKKLDTDIIVSVRGVGYHITTLDSSPSV